MSTSTHEAAHQNPGPPHVEEVAAGVFAYVQPDGTWWINNTGFVVGRSGLLSIDSCATERRTRAYLDTLRRVAGRRPTMLLNTHHHGDHTNGNYLFEDAAVIGHERCRELIAQSGILRPDGIFQPVEWGELQPAPPFLTIHDRLNVYVDDLLVELHHFGTAAHTTNDVVAWIPEHRVLFTGDVVFNGGTPFVLMGSVAGSLTVLDRLVELDPAVIVPGHGPPCGPAQLDVVGEYLRFVQLQAERTKAAGLSPLEAAHDIDLGDFAALTDSERLAGNLHRAYAELDGAQPGAPVDVMRAFADMVAFNGDTPLRCMA